MLLLLAACVPTVPGTKDDASNDADSTVASRVDSAGPDSGHGDSTSHDTPRDTADSGPPRFDTGPLSTGEPFILTTCGGDDGDNRLFSPVPDRDGDGIPELLVYTMTFTGAVGSVAWLVLSSRVDGNYWDSPLRWDASDAHDTWTHAETWPDRDGDGVAEILVRNPGRGAAELSPAGALWTAWTDMPDVVIPWHDVDGDGQYDFVIGDPDVDADLDGYMGYFGVVTAPDATPSGWTARIAVSGHDADRLGLAMAAGSVDEDGDGYGELFITDDTDGWLLGSAAVDAGASLPEGTIRTYAGIGGMSISPLGDVDGDGLEDVAFIGLDGEVCFSRGADEGATTCLGSADLNGAEQVAVGSDGAGGLALWTTSGDAVNVYDLADALLGIPTRVTTASSPEIAQIATMDDGIWLGPKVDYDSWIAEVAAERLDPATLTVTSTIQGGGWGGLAGYGAVGDLDGDGVPDWYLYDDVLWSTVPVPGETVSMCDVNRAEFPAWSWMRLGDDYDGDGVPERIFRSDDDESIGVWSPSGGTLREEAYGGYAWPLCDLNADGVQEIQLWDPPDYRVLDGASFATHTFDEATIGTLTNAGECLGDIDGDGIAEVGAMDERGYVVRDGAALYGGSDAVAVTIAAGRLGSVDHVYALGDFDRDGQNDVLLEISPHVLCVVRGADLWASPATNVDTLGTDCIEQATYLGIADVDRDGYPEVVYEDSEPEFMMAWTPADGAERVLWDYSTDAYPANDGYFYPNAFPDGRDGMAINVDPYVLVPVE